MAAPPSASSTRNGSDGGLVAAAHRDPAVHHLGRRGAHRDVDVADREVLGGPVGVVGRLEHVDGHRVGVLGGAERVEHDRGDVEVLGGAQRHGGLRGVDPVAEPVDDVHVAPVGPGGRLDDDRPGRGLEPHAGRGVGELDRDPVPSPDQVVGHHVHGGPAAGSDGDGVGDRQRRLRQPRRHHGHPGRADGRLAVGVDDAVLELVGADRCPGRPGTPGSWRRTSRSGRAAGPTRSRAGSPRRRRGRRPRRAAAA